MLKHLSIALALAFTLAPVAAHAEVKTWAQDPKGMVDLCKVGGGSGYSLP